MSGEMFIVKSRGEGHSLAANTVGPLLKSFALSRMAKELDHGESRLQTYVKLCRIYSSRRFGAISDSASAPSVSFPQPNFFPKARQALGQVFRLTSCRKYLIFLVPTRAPGKGTGMGLAVCKEIVKRHGGAIHITSQEGRGTTVGLVLPIDGMTGRDVAAVPIENRSPAR